MTTLYFKSRESVAQPGEFLAWCSPQKLTSDDPIDDPAEAKSFSIGKSLKEAEQKLKDFMVECMGDEEITWERQT